MSKKALLVLGLTAMFAAPSFAGVFADVPFDHWAYPAVEELAQVGVLEGYPDGTFRGPQPMTRYEFAVATERAYRRLVAMIEAVDGVSEARVREIVREMMPTGTGGGVSEERVRALIAELAPKPDGTGLTEAQVRQIVQSMLPEVNEMTADQIRAIVREMLPVVPTVDDLRTRIDTLERLTREFRTELDAMGAQAEAMLARLTALETLVNELAEQVASNTSRIADLERMRWFASVRADVGADGQGNAGAAPDGDLEAEPGEAFSVLSMRAGLEANLGGETRGRFTWWYDTDGNQHHGITGGGRVGPNPGVVVPARAGGLDNLGIDEAWVRTPGLGGEWIFGRQYAGQDYETGEAKPSLGLGTGYYTGAALTGVKAQYGFGNWLGLTALVQADDNILTGAAGTGANIAGVARADIDLPWWRNDAGEPFFKLGVQTVAHWPSAGASPVVKNFNDGTGSREFSASADLQVRVLKGLRIEYTNQFQTPSGFGPDQVDFDGNAEGQAVYAELGILDTPTFVLDIAGGFVENDFTLSHSIITNPYVPSASAAFMLFDRPVILDTPAYRFGATAGVDGKLSWNVTRRRPLGIRAAASVKDSDPFNWMVYASFPVVLTDNGNVSVGAGYIDVDAGHVLAQDTIAARVSAAFGF